MRLDPDACRERLAAAQVARLATADADGKPHVVPVTFALDGDRVVMAVDQKPKSTVRLKRLRNIEVNPAVALLADRYDDDWTQLWWVRADGRATVLAESTDALGLLAAKYHQYASDPPRGPVIEVTITTLTGWSYSG
jgi:PPOX class probable F420-dependent enzyme